MILNGNNNDYIRSIIAIVSTELSTGRSLRPECFGAFILWPGQDRDKSSSLRCFCVSGSVSNTASTRCWIFTDFLEVAGLTFIFFLGGGGLFVFWSVQETHLSTSGLPAMNGDKSSVGWSPDSPVRVGMNGKLFARKTSGGKLKMVMIPGNFFFHGSIFRFKRFIYLTGKMKHTIGSIQWHLLYSFGSCVSLSFSFHEFRGMSLLVNKSWLCEDVLKMTATSWDPASVTNLLFRGRNSA